MNIKNSISKNLVITILGLLVIITMAFMFRCSKSIDVSPIILGIDSGALEIIEKQVVITFLEEENKVLKDKIMNDSLSHIEEIKKQKSLSRKEKYLLLSKNIGGEVIVTQDSTLVYFNIIQVDSTNRIILDKKFIEKELLYSKEVIINNNEIINILKSKDSIHFVINNKLKYKYNDLVINILPKKVKKAKTKGIVKGLLIGIPAGIVITIVAITKIR